MAKAVGLAVIPRPAAKKPNHDPYFFAPLREIDAPPAAKSPTTGLGCRAENSKDVGHGLARNYTDSPAKARSRKDYHHWSGMSLTLNP